MTIYKVLVVNEDQQFVYESGNFADFNSAHIDLISQLLETATEDYTVEAEDIDKVVTEVEQVSVDTAGKQYIVMLGQYAHCLLTVD